MISDRITPRGMSRLGFFDSAPNAVADSKPTTRRMAIVDWNMTSLKLFGVNTSNALD